MIRNAARAAVVCAFAWNAHAQSAAPLQRTDPADPALLVPAARYNSPYTGYQRFEEQKPASWRALNDEVERLGGHQGHIKDAAEPPRAPAANDGARVAPSKPPAPQAVPDPAPKPAASGAHKHHH